MWVGVVWRVSRRVTQGVLLSAALFGVPTVGSASVTVDAAIAGPSGQNAIQTLAVSPSDPNVMVSGSYFTPGRLFRTTDRGATWSSLSLSGSAAAIALPPSNPDIIYVALAQSLFTALEGNYVANGPTIVKSVDRGVNWQTVSQLTGDSITVNSLAVDRLDANTLYVPNFASDILKSADGGASWAVIASACAVGGGGFGGGSSGGGFGGGSSSGGGTVDCTGRFMGTISAFALDPNNSSIMYVTSYYGSIYRSADAGQTWALLSNTSNLVGVTSIAVHPSDSDKLYATTSGGIVVVSVTNATLTTAFQTAATDPAAMLVFTREAAAQLYQVQPQQPQLRSFGGGAMGHFGFNEQHNAALSAQVTSNEVRILSTSGGAQSISISGGEYSINDNIFTSTTGSINVGDRVKVRLTAAATLSTTTTAMLNIGGTVGHFNVTTRSANLWAPSINWTQGQPLLGPIQEGIPVSASFQMTDRDGDLPRCYSSTLPDGATLASTASGECIISWTTSRGDAGTYTPTIIVTDGVATQSYNFSIVITPALPVLTAAMDEGSGTETTIIKTEPTASQPEEITGLVERGTWTAGVYSNAVQFSGNGQARAVVNLVPFYYGLSSLTVEAWVKPTMSGQTAYAVSHSSSNVFGSFPVDVAYGLGFAKGKLRAVLQGVAHVSTATVPTDVWSHLALTWSGQTLKLFLNGANVYEAPHTLVPEPYGAPLIIGGDGRDRLVGAVDAVRVWRVARLHDELCAEAGRQWTGVACTGRAFGNAVPVASSAVVTVGANDVVSGQLQASDANGEALTYAIVTPPARGTVVIEDAATGRYSYRAGNFVGQTDSFTFVAIDKFARSRAAKVSIQIGPVSSVDTDGDVMTDKFEVAHGLDPTNVLDGALDADRDAIGNYDEFVAHTDPTIAAESDSQHVLGMSFSEGLGVGPTLDATSYRHVGGLTNTTWVQGRRGYGLRFAATSSVSIPDGAALDITGAISIDMWVRPTSALQNAFFAAKDVDANVAFAYGLGLANGALRAQFGSNRYTSAYVLPINVWTHVAATWDGATVRLYANGVEVYRAARSTALPVNNAPLVIGARSKVGGIAQGFRGDIDQVNVWRKAYSLGDVCRASGGSYDGSTCVH